MGGRGGGWVCGRVGVGVGVCGGVSVGMDAWVEWRRLRPTSGMVGIYEIPDWFIVMMAFPSWCRLLGIRVLVV